MEKVIGPIVSVSTSGYYLTGYSTDTLSGTAGYCYNTSTSTPSKNSYTSVANRPTSKYAASQYHVTSSNTYRFHAIDTAGNHNYDSTSKITYYTYHCNYCGQDTNLLHYNCPTHYSNQTCSTSSGSSCAVGGGTCGSSLTSSNRTYNITSHYCSVKRKYRTTEMEHDRLQLPFTRCSRANVPRVSLPLLRKHDQLC